MAEEKTDKTEEEKPGKLASRKFVVWLVWCVITVLAAVVVLICCIKNVSGADSAIEVFKATLQDFFYVSLLYLGANVGQKAAFAISDAISSKNEEGLQ